MKKRILLSLAAVIAISLGIVGMSAYEAHIINVTAHIENALSVPIDEIEFGTVFPQEYLNSSFDIALSDSFKGEDRVDDVNYVIKQKSKCECDKWVDTKTPVEDCPEGQYTPVGYATHVCPAGYTAMLSLCPFLSKTDGDPADGNDISHPSYFIDPTTAPGDESCIHPETIVHGWPGFGDGGWAGWSCPAGTVAVSGGVDANTNPVGGSGLAIPGATIGGFTYPVFPHYTFSAGETGYVVYDLLDGLSNDITIHVDCMPIVPDASGKLSKLALDTTDVWTVDLKVPPFEGYVAQDWPDSCPVLPIEGYNPEGTDLGCDLWVEVTGISETPPPPVTP